MNIISFRQNSLFFFSSDAPRKSFLQQKAIFWIMFVCLYFCCSCVFLLALLKHRKHRAGKFHKCLNKHRVMSMQRVEKEETKKSSRRSRLVLLLQQIAMIMLKRFSWSRSEIVTNELPGNEDVGVALLLHFDIYRSIKVYINLSTSTNLIAGVDWLEFVELLVCILVTQSTLFRVIIPT